MQMGRAILSLVGLAVGLASAQTRSSANGNSSKNNILFLMCDSMDGRVIDASNGVSKYMATPVLDGLAKDGVNFVRTFAASPQCVPSRTSMLAGRRTDQIGAWSNSIGFAQDPSGALDKACVKAYDAKTCAMLGRTQKVNRTFFDALSSAMDVALFGKVDIGHNVLTRYGPQPTVAGWHGGPSLTIFARAADIRKPTKPTPSAITNDKDDHVHPEDWKMHTACIDWLHARADVGRDGRPWFLYCSLNIPHPPFNTNLTWLQSVDEASVKATPPAWPAMSELHPYDSYMTISKGVGDGFKISDYDVFKVRRTWYAMVSETDFLMGQVLEAAKARDDYARTLVIFLSDHGEMNMEHRQVSL